jgi:hypothetical protein
MSDGELRQVFRKHLSSSFDFQAVETGAVGDGVPDLNYCGGGVEGWVEMKKADHWRASIRPAQVGWTERRLRYGGRVFVAVRRARDELWFFHGKAIRPLVKERIDEVENLGCWAGGPAKWDWKEIARCMRV